MTVRLVMRLLVLDVSLLLHEVVRQRITASMEDACAQTLPPRGSLAQARHRQSRFLAPALSSRCTVGRVACLSAHHV